MKIQENNQNTPQPQSRENYNRQITAEAQMNRINIQNDEASNTNQTIDINAVRSDHLLLTEMIPFTDEGDLPTKGSAKRLEGRQCNRKLPTRTREQRTNKKGGRGRYNN